jgi:hypothetical protein
MPQKTSQTWTVSLVLGTVEAVTQEEAMGKAIALATKTWRLEVKPDIATSAPVGAPRASTPAMAPIASIAHELGVGVSALRHQVDRLYRAGDVPTPYVKTAEGSLYPVEAVKTAIAPHMPELLDRQRVAQEHEAAERAAAEARRVERAHAHAAHVARKAARAQARAQQAPAPSRRGPRVPEVNFYRKEK